MPRKKTLKSKALQSRFFFLLLILFMLIIFALGMIVGQLSVNNLQKNVPLVSYSGINLDRLQEEVLPKKGYVFKINWGDLGRKMIQDGVLDEAKLAKAVSGSDKLSPDLKKYLDETNQSQISLNQDNAQFWVDVLWGLGLASKNEILEKGPMQEGGNTANFASTGGYTIGKKSPMDIYSKFSYFNLSSEQQAKVSEIAGNIYRPCCGNSTAFPDCNHGMAALGLIELMVSQNKSKDEIYKTVLAFNSYWFPQTYLDIAYHFQKSGRSYKSISALELLSKTFSSAMGYQVIKKEVGQVAWPLLEKGGSCGA
ncbi:hypothetical protein M1146_03185 [Patescibacteria group bacterium]|nr:hypothetical protein [Patescibacteria group bacterium]